MLAASVDDEQVQPTEPAKEAGLIRGHIVRSRACRDQIPVQDGIPAPEQELGAASKHRMRGVHLTVCPPKTPSTYLKYISLGH